MKECIFCVKYEKGEGILYEGKYFYSQLDLFPISPGHAEVIPKRHVANLADLTSDEWTDLHPAIEETKKIIEMINLEEVYSNALKNPINESSVNFLKEALASPFLHKTPDAYNYGINDGRAAGRTIDHFHWHVIPRYNGDVENPRGGVRHIIPGKGSY